MPPIVLREIPCDVPSGRAALHSPSGTIRVELARGEIFEPGLIAGAEGLGSELFLDTAHRLVAVDLDLRPHHVISVPPAGIVRSARDSMRAAARPTCAGIDRPVSEPINPDRIVISPALDAAILAFGGAVPEHTPSLLYLALSSVMTVGVDPYDHALRLILVEAFTEEQFLFDQPVSAQTRPADFRDALNALHRHYYASASRADFEQTADTILAGASGDWSALEALADVYLRDLEMMRAYGRS
jgi:hypothetical protein